MGAGYVEKKKKRRSDSSQRTLFRTEKQSEIEKRKKRDQTGKFVESIQCHEMRREEEKKEKERKPPPRIDSGNSHNCLDHPHIF